MLLVKSYSKSVYYLNFMFTEKRKLDNPGKKPAKTRRCRAKAAKADNLMPEIEANANLLGSTTMIIDQPSQVCYDP